eukprot:m.487986 g.487986  ORF g.487986 m.487986 type:complete len:593 (+) comp25457_c0_seq1:54-1832(+)
MPASAMVLTMLALVALMALMPVVDVKAEPAVVPKSAGILYEVWHTKASQAMKEVADRGFPQLTTERVIRSNGTKILNDVYGAAGVPASDVYNVEPQLGFYCLYRKRAGDAHPPLPDCENITHTASAHAAMLLEAGFDYITVDVTNWPQNNSETDIAVIRPTEVLFEEWTALRAAGVKTPAISIWPCSPANSTTWRYLLATLYNNPKYDPLVWRNPSSGKKVVFVPKNSHCYDEAESAAIERNGGRNDIEVIRMWALDEGDFSHGVWGFFSYCRDQEGNPTTSMVGTSDCDQVVTTDPASNQTTEVSASGAYMVSQSGLPFANPGHMRGLTLSRLFKKVLDVGAPHLFVSSFNEHIGGRQVPACGASICFNQGLPNDPQRHGVWVDTYASEFSRDIEPTVEAGSVVWEVARACVQLYKQGATCATHPTSPCCTTVDKEVFANVWSFVHDPTGRHYLTANATERAQLIATAGWRQLCSPVPGPTASCTNGTERDGRTGPFILYTTPQTTPATQPLYRCTTDTDGDLAFPETFVSLSASCEGRGRGAVVLGHLATTRGREMLRSISRCNTAGGGHAHALDLACNLTDTGVLGFVR